MPVELRLEAEAYRLCQPMHVLSFGEGRKRKSFWLPSPIWDRGPLFHITETALRQSSRKG